MPELVLTYLARLYPFTRHSKESLSAARIRCAPLLRHQPYSVTCENLLRATTAAAPRPTHPRRSGALSSITPLAAHPASCLRPLADEPTRPRARTGRAAPASCAG